MTQNQNPQMPVPPGGLAENSPQTASDLSYAADLIKAVGGDIALLAQNQNEELDQLDSLAKQVAYVREVLDYGLFVTPDQVERKEDLYPFAAWLYNKLEEISTALTMTSQATPVESDTAVSSDEMKTLVAAEVQRIEDSVQSAKESLTSVIEERMSSMQSGGESGELAEQVRASGAQVDDKLNELGEYVQRIESRQDDQLRTIRSQLDSIKEQGALSPYDDFDVQVEELRLYLKDQTAKWRIQENIFFGAVIFMLFINMGMLLWLNLTG